MIPRVRRVPSTWSALLLGVLIGTGCARHIPSHLQLESATADSTEVEAPSSAFERLVVADPWARHLSPTEQQELIASTPEQAKQDVEEALLAIESRKVSAGRSLSRLERTWQSTAVPALLRGYRVQLLQAQWGASDDEDSRRYTQAVSLLTGLHESPPPERDARPEWGWLPDPPPADVLPYAYMDRWVLRAWQATPDAPLASLAAPLVDGTRQRLGSSGEGKLLLARGNAPQDCADTTPDAWARLVMATDLALERASADRDHEQAQWGDRRRATQKELGIKSDPIAHLLASSHTGLVRCAADDRAGGGALLADAASRWTRGCAQGCDGLDRTANIVAAGSWHEDVDALAQVWMVIALKESLDSMEVARSTVMFRPVADDLIDLLLTVSPGGVDALPLFVTSPSATFWNRLGRSITEERIVSWPELKAHLCEILSDRAKSANNGTLQGFSENLIQLEERAHLTCSR